MKILIDTGALLRSIHYQADNTSVAIGTNKNYAAQLQEGVGMPARPFLGINANDRAYVMAALTKHMTEAAQKGAKI